MISIVEVLLLGLILSIDSFSAALAMGLKPHQTRDAMNFASLSAGAELIAALIGAIAGEQIILVLGPVARWIGFILLSAVSLHMLYEGFIEYKNRNEAVSADKFHGFFKLLVVAVATSLDALAVGVSVGLSGKALWPYLLSICAWAFIMTIIGMGIAKKAPQRLSAVFNVLGAIILFVIAVEMLY
ncbi:manganese efflux pump [Legionella sp. 16cNR16C]|uniref:manganese efflux pump MntP n=1 Tax=Legionella sp. 16cNR16C TaxID=2905656 RepID=UPI001E412101|nr:manganese efflux pump [Legionella sp. 16cNR16C]MCE3046441.1 manganese efflux pump [Legionella sp. 16cNR16C]